jgi:hypothetical protein
MTIRRRRPLLRAAMVGGVASHAGKRAHAEQQTAAPAPTAEGLPQPKQAGVLTEAEFDAQKQLLGS